jgi:hypothetical protein
VEVGTAEPDELRVGIREETALQERVVREIDSGYDVTGVERDLLRLREEIIGVTVERQPPHALKRHQLLGHDLGGIEQVEVEPVLLRLLDHLQAELPFGVRAVRDRFSQVAPVKVRILAGDLERLVPEHGVHAEQRLPVELHEA